MSTNPNKRSRREDTQPGAVKCDGGVTAGFPDVIEPKLEEIPNILMVGFQSNNVDTVKRAIEELYIITCTGDDADESRNEASKLGAMAFLLVASWKWSNNEEILEACLNCIGGIISHDNDPIKQDTESFFACGGIELAVSAIKSAPHSPGLTGCALFVLRNAFGSDSDESGALKAKFALELEGVKCVLNAMEKHPQNADIQEDGCKVLFHVAKSSEESRRAIIDNGGANAAAKACNADFLYASNVVVKTAANLLKDVIFGDK